MIQALKDEDPVLLTAFHEAVRRSEAESQLIRNTERESVVQPVLYALVPPFSALAELLQERVARDVDRRWAVVV
jgi:hypothetical protein